PQSDEGAAGRAAANVASDEAASIPRSLHRILLRDPVQLLEQIRLLAGAQTHALRRVRFAGVEIGVAHGAVEVDAVALVQDLRRVELGVHGDGAAGDQEVLLTAVAE